MTRWRIIYADERTTILEAEDEADARLKAEQLHPELGITGIAPAAPLLTWQAPPEDD